MNSAQCPCGIALPPSFGARLPWQLHLVCMEIISKGQVGQTLYIVSTVMNRDLIYTANIILVEYHIIVLYFYTTSLSL